MLKIDGREFKTQEAADYVYQSGLWLYTSGRADLYDWNKRYCLMQRSVGYIKMAAELEPYNPDIIWLEAFYIEASDKSSEYMMILMKNLLSRMKQSVENGYTKPPAPNTRIMEWALKAYARKVESGIMWERSW
jgi:hypothetical protein